MKQCIMILTCTKSEYEHMRFKQWDSSTKHLAEKFDIFYLIGGSGHINIPVHPNVHLLRAPCQDWYEDIPMKVWYGLWYLHYFYEGVLKLDDNIIIKHDAFLSVYQNEIAQYPYISFNGIAHLPHDALSFHHAGKTHMVMLSHMPVYLRKCSYAGGPAYYVSSQAISMLSVNKYKYELYEDYALGISLLDKGIKVHKSTIIKSGYLTDLGNPKSDPIEYAHYKNTLIDATRYSSLYSSIKCSAPADYVCYIHIHGGLGNQLFQLATAVSYSINTSLPVRILTGKSNQLYWDTALKKWKHHTCNIGTSISDTAIKIHKEPDFNYSPIPIVEGSIMLNGYFQSYKYFENITYNLKNLLDIAWIDPHPANHVIVHARRGDYVKVQNYHGLIGLDYYTKSMLYMSKHIADPVFLLLSDDPDFWTNDEARSAVSAYNTKIVHIEDTLQSFAYMAAGSNFIIANSTFSWWAAMLSQQNIVIAPIEWFGKDGPRTTGDLIPPTWLRL
jgi:hypothetical protein